MKRPKRTTYRALLTMLILVLLLCCTGPSLTRQGEIRSPLPLAQAQAAQANTYYVAPGGKDSNPGTILYPWRTIQKAANTLVAGDTVTIRAGTYPEQVVPQNSGSAGSPITYAAYPGETVTIDGSGITLPEWNGLFNLVGQDYIRVSGLRVINAGPGPHNPGILVEDASHIIIEHTYVYHSSDSGIMVWNSNNVTVAHNEIEDACYGGYNESITVGRTDAFEVRYNHVHHSIKEGICAKDGASNGKVFGNHVHDTDAVGIYVDAQAEHTYNIAVFANVVHDIAANGFAVASEQGGSLENVRLYNNIAHHNKWVGFQVSSCCIAQHPMLNVQFINNTAYNNGWDSWGGGIALDNPQVEGVVIRNNICSQNLYFQIAVDPSVPAQNYTIDHNLIDGYRDHGDEGETRGSAFVEGDPLFVNPSAANFHLQAGSPAIDQGYAVGAPADDYDGIARPQDGDQDGAAGYDIGAHEAVALTEQAYLPAVLKNYQKMSASWWTPPVGASWQVQYSVDALDQSFAVDLYDVDLFDTDAATIAALHTQGRRVLCYVNVGAWEDWRPDAAQFPATVLGDDYAGWPGERWLDIRRVDLLGPLMRARFDLAQAKGCDGIDPDNVNGYTNETGFPLSAQDQLTYNRWIANEAHARGLSIGLKNDEAQANDLLPYFDWALTESCFAEGWCAEMQPFIDAGKPVLAIEYTDTVSGAQFLAQTCSQAAAMRASAILKHRQLDEWRQACP